jgi:alkylhydroperoxidase family enzyme
MVVALNDLESAPIPAGLRAVCKLIAKLTKAPDSVTPDDIDRVRNAGVSDPAISDALHVAALFDIINRCANALDFELMDDYAPGGRHPLLESGYLGQVSRPG